MLWNNRYMHCMGTDQSSSVQDINGAQYIQGEECMSLFVNNFNQPNYKGCSISKLVKKCQKTWFK